MKNIVICCDGTFAEYSDYNTNVVKVYRAIVGDPTQIAFHDSGVGTFSFQGRDVGRRVGITFGVGRQQNMGYACR